MLWGERGKEGKGRVGRMDRTKRKERAVRHLDSELLAEVGEEILVPVGGLAAQPHYVVWTPRDRSSHTMEYCSTTKRNKLLLPATTWMNLKTSC